MVRPERCGECGGVGPVQAHHHDYVSPSTWSGSAFAATRRATTVGVRWRAGWRARTRYPSHPRRKPASGLGWRGAGVVEPGGLENRRALFGVPRVRIPSPPRWRPAITPLAPGPRVGEWLSQGVQQWGSDASAIPLGGRISTLCYRWFESRPSYARPLGSRLAAARSGSLEPAKHVHQPHLLDRRAPGPQEPRRAHHHGHRLSPRHRYVQPVSTEQEVHSARDVVA